MSNRRPQIPPFKNPIHFDHVRRSNKWVCNICPQHPKEMNTDQALFHETTSQHAHNLEVLQDQSAWWNPLQTSWESWNHPIEQDLPLTKDAMKDREHRYFADQVDDLVPFWIRGVEAAERGGQVSKLSDFLESLEDRYNTNTNVWPPRVHNPWRNPDAHSFIGGRDHDWEQKSAGHNDGWGLVHVNWDSQAKSLSSWDSNEQNIYNVSENRTTRRSEPREGGSGDLYNFVEEIAVQEAADEQRKRQMHSFFEVQKYVIIVASRWLTAFTAIHG
ncbi:hypothetical protein WG66_015171 [Moniliophthora roreri]|nr:hypothetical protein WG66_015171 [Moniliophthora roreri]